MLDNIQKLRYIFCQKMLYLSIKLDFVYKSGGVKYESRSINKECSCL